MKPRYKVWPIPESQDDDMPGRAWFVVQGPDVDYYTRMLELSFIMERALNAATEEPAQPAKEPRRG